MLAHASRDAFLAWEKGTSDAIDFKNIYVDMAGDLVAGLMLAQIVFWHLPGRKGQSKLSIERENELWLAKGRADWWEECRLSPKQADRALGILVGKGMIVTNVWHFKGVKTTHLRIDWATFLEAWGAALPDDADDATRPILTDGEHGCNEVSTGEQDGAESPPGISTDGNPISTDRTPKLTDGNPMLTDGEHAYLTQTTTQITSETMQRDRDSVSAETAVSSNGLHSDREELVTVPVSANTAVLLHRIPTDHFDEMDLFKSYLSAKQLGWDDYADPAVRDRELSICRQLLDRGSTPTEVFECTRWLLSQGAAVTMRRVFEGFRSWRESVACPEAEMVEV